MQILALALAGAIGVPATAQDIEAGRKLAGMCRTCHGIDGYAVIPIAPHIGGEPAIYLENQLKAFRGGSRVHEMMTVVAAPLSDTQIADVAAWYASHNARATLPENASPDDAPAACIACHGADGISSLEDAPNLAGEVNIYLETQLKAFKTGRRSHEIMTGIAADLSSEQMRELANWYAAIKLEISPAQ
jgi:cytochrome c553